MPRGCKSMSCLPCFIVFVAVHTATLSLLLILLYAFV